MILSFFFFHKNLFSERNKHFTPFDILDFSLSFQNAALAHFDFLPCHYVLVRIDGFFPSFYIKGSSFNFAYRDHELTINLIMNSSVTFLLAELLYFPLNLALSCKLFSCSVALTTLLTFLIV